MTQRKQVTYRGIVLPYDVSDTGEVRRIPGRDCAGRMRKGNIITPHLVAGGYLQVILKYERKTYSPLVHALVAFAFLPDPPGEYGRGKIAVNHKNGIKTDNSPSNLEWVTYKQNSEHASTTGLMLTGEDNPNSRFSEGEIIEIRRLRDAGMTYRAIAKQFNSVHFTIISICKRVTWKHI